MTIFDETPKHNNTCIHTSTQEEAALKAKLRRLCAPRKDGTLGVPDWVHQQWKQGDHLAMAKEFERVGFNKDLFVYISLGWFVIDVGYLDSKKLSILIKALPCRNPALHHQEVRRSTLLTGSSSILAGPVHQNHREDHH